ncbi:MAG TPA: hypothetical protein VHZ24_05590 [Pirellulales bacterium]|nr:hypothetical protein [Pirellulales bacterium]
MPESTARRFLARLPLVARWAIVAAQVATVLVTWPLWQVREWPPMLPAVSSPQVSCGWAMLVSALAVLIVPRWGLTAHAVVVAVAMLMDQTRMQPEIVSHCLLLLGTLPGAGPKLIGRLHLITLWFFSGVHKLFSAGFYDEVAPFLWNGIFPRVSQTTIIAFGLVLAATEIALGLFAAFPRTRRAAAIAGALFHIGVFVSLSPVGLDWNQAVWPWNLALAAASLGLLFDWRGSLWLDVRTVLPAWRIAAVGLLVAPATYYVGGLDAYLSHCLYSGNTPRGFWRHGHVTTDLTMLTIEKLGVPLPPTHRTFWAMFRAAGQPDDQLYVFDPRWFARWRGWHESVYDYPAEER